MSFIWCVVQLTWPGHQQDHAAGLAPQSCLTGSHSCDCPAAWQDWLAADVADAAAAAVDAAAAGAAAGSAEPA